MVTHLMKVRFGASMGEQERFEAVCGLVGELIQAYGLEDVEVIYWATLDGPVLEEEEALERDSMYMEVECL
jgi:hypothetical protein